MCNPVKALLFSLPVLMFSTSILQAADLNSKLALFDDNYVTLYGDEFGRVNRMEMYYPQDLTAQTLPDSVILQWPRSGDEYKRRADRNNLTLDPNNPRHLTAIFPDPFPEGITGFTASGLNLAISYYTDPLTPGSETQASILSAVDSVGPLILTGKVIERLYPGHDTILITTSEPLKDVTVLNGSSVFLIKAVTDEVIPLDIVNTITYGEYYKLIIEDLGDSAPKKGDQIRFNPAGSVKDVNGVTVHPQNRPVTLELREIVPDIINAFYSDDNADGIVENATIVFNKKVKREDLTLLFTWSNARSEDIGSSRLSYPEGDSTRIIVDLTNAFPTIVVPKTDGIMVVNIWFRGFIDTEQSYVNDKAAPVLVKAKLYPSDYLTIAQKDTLAITFSEPLPQPSTSDIHTPVFIIQKGIISAPELKFVSFRIESQSQYIYIYEVEDLNMNRNFTLHDSIYIKPNSDIGDYEGNIQNNPDNRRIPLSVNSQLPVVKIEPAGCTKYHHTIYNISGRKVGEVENRAKMFGHDPIFKRFPNGTYMIKTEINGKDAEITRKVLRR